MGIMAIALAISLHSGNSTFAPSGMHGHIYMIVLTRFLKISDRGKFETLKREEGAREEREIRMTMLVGLQNQCRPLLAGLPPDT